MITNSYKKYVYGRYNRTTVSNAVIDCEGAKHSSSPYGYSSNGTNMADHAYIIRQGFKFTTTLKANGGSVGVYFGSGSTPPTEDDYTLEAPISSGLSSVQTSLAECVDCSYIERAAIVKNTSAADITIREIGFFGVTVADGNSDSTNWLFLIDRTVLDEPITIPPGEVRTLTVRVENTFFG